jgi:hypothetical protein
LLDLGKADREAALQTTGLTEEVHRKAEPIGHGFAKTPVGELKAGAGCIPFHPLANMFALLDDAALHELGQDILHNGQLEPCVMLESQILDGRNRYLACLLVVLNLGS